MSPFFKAPDHNGTPRIHHCHPTSITGPRLQLEKHQAESQKGWGYIDDENEIYAIDAVLVQLRTFEN